MKIIIKIKDKYSISKTLRKQSNKFPLKFPFGFGLEGC